MRTKIYIIVLIALVILPEAGFILETVKAAVNKKLTHQEIIDKYKSKVEPVLKEYCRKQAMSYPPEHLYLVGLKAEKELRIYAESQSNGSKPKLIHTYQILAASGDAGPKLKQGDWQVPEGFYKIEAFNPNSKYHLSLRVNYPNKEDKDHAAKEERTNLGGDIMIHGSTVSVGCLAMGDDAIEEIYVLVDEVGRENTDVILSPCNLLEVQKPQIKMSEQPEWLAPLYERLKEQLKKFSS